MSVKIPSLQGFIIFNKLRFTIRQQFEFSVTNVRQFQPTLLLISETRRRSRSRSLRLRERTPIFPFRIRRFNLQRLPAARTATIIGGVVLLPDGHGGDDLASVVLDKALEILMQNADERLVGIAIGLLLGGEGEEAELAHLANVGEFLVVVAVGEGGDVLLVRFADGIVVVEIGLRVEEEVVDSGAEEAGEAEFEEFGEFVGEKGEEAVEEEEEDENPFEDCADEEVRELAEFLLDEAGEGALLGHDFQIKSNQIQSNPIRSDPLC